MGITVEFKDYEEMVAFAHQLIGESTATTGAQPVQQQAPQTTITKDAETADAQPAEETPTYTLEQVRAKLTELTRAGKQKEVKALITSFGAKNVTSIEEKDYAAVMKKAGEL